MNEKSSIPSTLGLALRFIKHLPDAWRRHCNLYYSFSNGRHNALFLDANTVFYSPDVLMFWKAWNHALTTGSARKEIDSFLRLSTGCHKLLDLGASLGLFTVLFWITRKNPEVHALEPETRSFELLNETRRLNCLEEQFKNWVNSKVAIGGEDGTIQLYDSYFYSSVMAPSVERPITAGEYKIVDTPMQTIASYSKEHNFIPDIIKLDIESFEFETLIGAEAFLSLHKPKLHLELHNNMIRERGKDPKDVLQMLAKLGYKDSGNPINFKTADTAVYHYYLE